VFIII
jgi:hypothetical protein